MNKVSLPVRLLLLGVLVFAALWFTVLKPGTPSVDPVPAPAASTPVDAGGTTATSAAGKAVESANNAAAKANSATQRDEAQTGEQSPSSTTGASATTPGAANTATAGAPGSSTGTVTPKTSAVAKSADSGRSAAQQSADAMIESVISDLKARRAVVVLVYQPGGTEDEIVKTRVQKKIDRHGGKVRVYLVRAARVGLYDGLLGDLALAQTPSTVVIAPDNSAKVLGGLVSTVRIDRLTSAALLTKPTATK